MSLERKTEKMNYKLGVFRIKAKAEVGVKGVENGSSEVSPCKPSST